MALVLGSNWLPTGTKVPNIPMRRVFLTELEFNTGVDHIQSKTTCPESDKELNIQT